MIGADGPWRTMSGELVAIDKDDLVDGNLAHGIDVTEKGEPTTGFVWTGTEANGTNAPHHCGNWSSTTGVQGVYGRASETGSEWTMHGTTFGTVGCTSTYSLYCFQVP